MAGFRFIKGNFTDLTRKQEELIAYIGSDDYKIDVNTILLEEARRLKYIPKRTGRLERDGEPTTRGIKYSVHAPGNAKRQYALYQYYGKVYGPVMMTYRHDREGNVTNKKGWRSKKGAKKHPTGRELGSKRFVMYDYYGFPWKFGYNRMSSRSHWFYHAYKNNTKRFNQRLTSALKRRLKNG